MYYIKDTQADGKYIAKNGTRFAIFSATAVVSPERWTWFDTLDACLTAWGLTYDPLPEQQGATATPNPAE